MRLPLPRLTTGSLSDLVPSLLAGLGVPGFAATTAALGGLLPAGTHGVCLLLVDGLGWRLLREHAGDAPFLASLAQNAEPITAGSRRRPPSASPRWAPACRPGRTGSSG